MSKNIVVLLLLLCAGGFFLCANGDDSKESSASTESTSLQSNGGSSTIGKIAGLPKKTIEMIARMVEKAFNKIWEYLRPIVRGTSTLIVGTLEFVFSSDDTTMVRRRRSTTSYHYEGNPSANGDGIGGMFAKAFMIPFKLAFGTVRSPVVKSMTKRVIGGAEQLLQLVKGFLRTPAVETVTNATMLMVEHATSQVWNFSKVNVFPQLDSAVTTLRKSNTLPANVDTYLGDVQTVYHIMVSLGIL